jgi:hypothetical protein
VVSADLLGAYALLLTTVALLQTLWYPDITAALKSLEKMPHYREDAIKLWQENRGVFHREALPLLVATTASLLAFIGPAIGVSFGPWQPSGHWARACSATTTRSRRPSSSSP